MQARSRFALVVAVGIAWASVGCGVLFGLGPDDDDDDAPGALDAGDAGAFDDAGAAEDGADDAGPTPVTKDAGPDAPPNVTSCDGGPACARVVFVTSASMTGDLGGLAGADARCDNLAAKSTIPRIKGRAFVAWLSNGMTDASARMIHASGFYIDPQGSSIAMGWDQFASVNHLATITLDEDGKSVAGLVWTGTGPDGHASNNTCAGWTSNASNASGDHGVAERMDVGWTDSGAETCDSPGHFYCVER